MDQAIILFWFRNYLIDIKPQNVANFVRFLRETSIFATIQLRNLVVKFVKNDRLRR